MKKSVRFLAFAVIASSIFSMTACGEEHTHTYANTWSKDATMHWHAGTCEHTDEMKDVSGHVDADKDGTCDICLYDGGHVHTYESTYSYDALNHWYAADCYHAVKDGVEAHQANALGYCVCGYKVSDPDVSTVAKAVQLGVSQNYLVNGGTVTKTTVDGNGTRTENGSFDIGDDYFHQLNYYNIRGSWSVAELWYAKVNDTVVAFERSGNEMQWYNVEIENEAVNGWFFDGNENANKTGKCYGIADYVESLYEVGVVDAMEGTFTESVENGVYAFSYDIYHDDSSDDVSTITVEFTLGESYFIETATVKAEKWYYAVDTNEDGIFEKPAGAPDSKVEYVIAQRTGDAVVKAFDPAEKVLSNFNLYQNDELVGDTLTVTAGTSTVLDVKDFAPETAADLTYEQITVTGVNADTEEEIDVSYWGDFVGNFLKSSKTLTINFKKVGTYNLTISSRCISKSLTLVVDYADVTSINATVNGVNATTGSTFVDESFSFGTAVNSYAENAATAEFTSVADGSTLTSADIRYNASTGMFLFMPDVAGEYVIKVTATNNATVSATLTVTVSEKPSVGPLFNGTWAGSVAFIDGAHTITAVFTPDATPVAGAEFSGSVVVSDAQGMDGGTYRYVYSNNEFKLYEADGTTAVSGYKWWVELNADMTMHAVYNTFDKGALVQQASSGGDTPVVGANTLKNTTWSATTSFLSAVVTAEFTEDKVVVTSSVKDTPGGTYSYTYDGATFAIYEEGTTTAVSGYKWWVKVEGGIVYAIYNKQDKGALVKQESEVGGDEPANGFAGSGAQSDPYVITEVPVDFDVKCDNKVYYQYTATANASLTITADSNDYWAQVTASNVSGDYAASDENCEPLTFNVQEGVTYTIMLFTWSEFPGEYGVSITVGEYTGDEGGDEPVLPDPIELVMGENTITVTAGDITNEVISATFWCSQEANYTFTSADGIVSIITVVDEYGMEYDVRNYATLYAWTEYSINLYVGGLEEAGDYVLTITNDAPIELADGDNTITVEEAGVIKGAYMPMANGDYTFTCPAGFTVVIYDEYENFMGENTAWLTAWATYTLEINVDDTVVAGEYTINVSFVETASLEIGENTITVTADDIANATMKFAFFSGDAGDYVFTANSESIQFQICTAANILVTRGGQASLEAYKTYLIYVNVAGVEAGEYTITVVYNAPAGHMENPVAIEELPATLTVPVAKPGYSTYYYELTVAEETTIVITFADANSTVSITDNDMYYDGGYNQASYTYTLSAGTYLIGLGTFDETIDVSSVSVTIAVESADEGGEEGGEEGGGDTPATGPITYVTTHANSRSMKVVVDLANGTLTIDRTDLTGNYGTGGAASGVYSFAVVDGVYTFEHVSGSTFTNITMENGVPVSITSGSATYTGFTVQA